MPSDQDDDAAVGRGLRFDRIVLVLNLLEGEALRGTSAMPAHSSRTTCALKPSRDIASRPLLPYRKLIHNASGAEALARLERQHRVVPLFRVIASAFAQSCHHRKGERSKKSCSSE